MKNKILLAVALLLIVLVVIARLIFNQKLEVFKTDLANYEAIQYQQFKLAKEQRLAEISRNEPLLFQHFVDSLDEQSSVVERDTLYAYLYLKKRVKYKSHSILYLDCLYDKCSVEEKNAKTLKLINKKEVELQNKFKEAFDLWYPQLNAEKLIQGDSLSDRCNAFFPAVVEFKYDASIWNEFDMFLREYTQQIRKAAAQNKSTVSQYENARWQTKNRLQNNFKSHFEDRLKVNQNAILPEKDVTLTFSAPMLGSIDYTVKQKTIDWERFNSIAEESFQEQWRNNSLATGSMPYSYCYGSSNYCGGYYCSEIHVRAGGSDVLVTIKNASERVVRHGYIQSNTGMTFHVPDGSYQVFFYSGKGWNPDKFMANTSCGKLLGGFVSNESFSKGRYEEVTSAILTYELISQVNGNFSPSSSSAAEAFN